MSEPPQMWPTSFAVLVREVPLVTVLSSTFGVSASCRRNSRIAESSVRRSSRARRFSPRFCGYDAILVALSDSKNCKVEKFLIIDVFCVRLTILKTNLPTKK